DQGCFAYASSGACADKLASGSGNSSTWPHGRFTVPSSACGKFSGTLPDGSQDPNSTYIPNAAVASHTALASICTQSKNKGGAFMQDPTQPGTANYVKYDGLLYN